MAIRAQARVTYSAAGSPAGTYLNGVSAPVDSGVGIATLTLQHPVDRTQGAVVACLACSASGTACTPVTRIEAILGTGTTADTTVRVRMYDSSGVLRDPAV